MSCSYRQAGAFFKIADGIFLWAARIIVIAAGGRLKWTASPCKARSSILIKTAAGIALRTGVIVVTDSWGHYWRRWRWAWVGRILTFLDRVGGLHCYSTFASCFANQIALHPNITCLSPACTPWVSHNPVINTIVCAIPNSSNSMVQCCPTSSCEYTLKRLG